MHHKQVALIMITTQHDQELTKRIGFKNPYNEAKLAKNERTNERTRVTDKYTSLLFCTPALGEKDEATHEVLVSPRIG